MLKGDDDPELRLCKYCFEPLNELTGTRKVWRDPATGVINLSRVRYHRDCLVRALEDERTVAELLKIRREF